MARSGDVSDDAVARRARGGRRARRLAELAEDVRHVAVDRVLADHELRGDLAVAVAGGDEPEDLAFATRQKPGGQVWSGGEQASRRRHAAVGLETAERHASIFGLRPCSGPEPELEKHLGERELRAGPLVRRREEVDGILEPASRALEIAARPRNLAEGVRRRP